MGTVKARFEELYESTIRPVIQKERDLNIMAVPRIKKIVLNIGVKNADGKTIQFVADTLSTIAGQAAMRTYAKKSIAGFKLREGMPIGACVTLRRKKMYEFLDRLLNLALPNVRDLQGVPTKFDGRGNYNLGIKEWAIFPELGSEAEDRSFGLNVTIHTTACDDEGGFDLLKRFGMPFRKVK